MTSRRRRVNGNRKMVLPIGSPGLVDQDLPKVYQADNDRTLTLSLKVASRLGLLEAVILQQIHFRSREHAIKDGDSCACANWKQDAFIEELPVKRRWFTEVCNRLEADGILCRKHVNGYVVFSIDYEALERRINEPD